MVDRMADPLRGQVNQGKVVALDLALKPGHEDVASRLPST
jgi:hypothetical protein